MPHESAEDFVNFTARLKAVKAAHDSWKSCLVDLAKMGKKAPKRQVSGVADQLEAFSAGAYSGLAKSVDPENKYPELHNAATTADASAGEMGEWLRTTYLPSAVEEDGLGAARYSVWARHYTGADLDLRDTYEWGLADLARMDGLYFDIDERIKFCDARLAPEGSAAAPYYQSPSEDLSRPGITWFPTQGKNEFNWWRIPTMWNHEAMLGHHLQVATVIIEKEHLTRFQRTEAWTSGHGEGWALYAERFMDELGAFKDSGLEMGHLSAQAWRASLDERARKCQ